MRLVVALRSEARWRFVVKCTHPSHFNGVPFLSICPYICSEDDEGSTRDDRDVADPDSRARRLQPGITVVSTCEPYPHSSHLSCRNPTVRTNLVLEAITCCRGVTDT